MVVRVEGGPKRPRLSSGDKCNVRSYLDYKRAQAQKAIATLEAAKVLDPTKFSEGAKKHWEGVVGTIDWLTHGLGNTAVR
jgi:hypothetical protein